MTCNRHPFENAVGVCATCLRQRLLALLATSSPDPFPSICSASPSSSSFPAAAAADPPRSSLLLNLFGKYDRRDEHELRRSTIPVRLTRKISRLFSSASAASGTERGASTNDASPRREKPLPTRRASTGTSPLIASCAAVPWHPSPPGRATAKQRRSRVAGLALCFVPLVTTTSPARRQCQGAGILFSGEIRGSRSKPSVVGRRRKSTRTW